MNIKRLVYLLLILPAIAPAQYAPPKGAVSPIPVTISTSSPVTVSTTPSNYYFNNSTGALTFNLPAISSAQIGSQICFRNYVTRTGAITIKAPTSTFIDLDGANGTSAGTLVSGGAAGDAACVVAISTTQYVAYIGKGTWANN